MTSEPRTRDGSSDDRNIFSHPKVQKFNAGLLWIMFIFVLGLAFTAGQKSTTIELIAKDVAAIKGQLEKTAPAVLAAQISALDKRLDGVESWLRAVSQRASASTPSLRGFTPSVSSSSSSHDVPP